MNHNHFIFNTSKKGNESILNKSLKLNLSTSKGGNELQSEYIRNQEIEMNYNRRKLVSHNY